MALTYGMMWEISPYLQYLLSVSTYVSKNLARVFSYSMANVFKSLFPVNLIILAEAWSKFRKQSLITNSFSLHPIQYHKLSQPLLIGAIFNCWVRHRQLFYCQFLLKTRVSSLCTFGGPRSCCVMITSW